MSEQPDLKALWADVITKVKEGDINLSLWDALAAAVPLVIEGDQFVVGFAPVNMKHSGYLQSPGNAAVLRHAVESVAGRRLQLLPIEGDSLEAWERYKSRMQAAASNTSAVAAGAKQRSAAEAWVEFGGKVRGLYYEMAGRERPVLQAEYLVKVIPMIARTEEELRERQPDAGELHDTEINKMIDRISSLCSVPPALIALEYLRYKGSRKKS